MKKSILLIPLAVFAILSLLVLGDYKLLGFEEISFLPENSPIVHYQESGFFDLKELIEKNFEASIGEQAKEQWTQVGVTSHHLPTALPFIADFYKTLADAQGPRETFVILGPDHTEKCYSSVSLTKESYTTPFGVLDVDNEIIDALLSAGASIDDKCFNGEHSIGVQTIFIKHLFPEAKIVPLIFSATTEDDVLIRVTDVLAGYADSITVIASVDFSHYLPYDQAVRKDNVSAQMTADLNGDFFTLEYVDSPASVKLAILLAEKLGFKKALISGRANSYDFTGQTENTTGYINAFFVKREKTDDLITLMFVGDIMLSRSVGDKMKKVNDWSWPFLKVADYLNGADLLFGNLEGPISAQGVNVGSIYSFRADPKTAQGLKYAGFDILSVANNHIGDWGEIAMEDTLRFLTENAIEYIGGGFSEADSHKPVIKEIKGVRFAFLAYTALGARQTEARGETSGITWLNVDRMKQDIKNVLEYSDFVVVSIHFGEEYQSNSNQFQKNAARSAIDAGASLVIGHHPHVIQEIENYNEGYIAYSLGNFIFDQFFSKETMEGLLLKVITTGKEIVKIEPIKINISRELQAELKE